MKPTIELKLTLEEARLTKAFEYERDSLASIVSELRSLGRVQVICVIDHDLEYMEGFEILIKCEENIKKVLFPVEKMVVKLHLHHGVADHDEYITLDIFYDTQ